MPPLAGQAHPPIRCPASGPCGASRSDDKARGPKDAAGRFHNEQAVFIPDSAERAVQQQFRPRTAAGGNHRLHKPGRLYRTEDLPVVAFFPCYVEVR